MTPSQRYYAANKDKPEFKARRLEAVNRYTERNAAKVAAAAKVRALDRQAAETPVDVAKRAAKVAARHAERMHDPAYREARRLQSQAERRRVDADPKRAARRSQREAEWRASRPLGVVLPVTPTRQAQQVDARALVAAVPNSVFGLAAVISGGGAERREGAEGPLTDQQFRETTWRAPWAAPYALSRR